MLPALVREDELMPHRQHQCQPTRHRSEPIITRTRGHRSNKWSGHRCQQEHRQDFGDHDAADAHTGSRQVVDEERKSDEVERVPPLGDRPGSPQPSLARLRQHLAQPRPGVPRSHFRNDEAANNLTVRRRVVALLRVDSHGRRISRGLAILAADT